MDPDKRRTLRRIASVPALGCGLSTIPASRAAETNELKEVSDVKKAEVHKALLGFKDAVPDKEEEQLSLIWDFSDAVDELQIEVLQTVDLSQLDDEVLIAESTLGVVKNVLGNINEAYDFSLPIKYVDEVTRLTKFIPFLSTGQNLLKVCAKIQERASQKTDFVAKMKPGEGMHELVEEFYIAILLVLVELALLGTSVGYRPAFAGTRYIANYGLVRVRSVVGLRGYSILLSVVHWIQRGAIEGTISYIIEKSDTIAGKLDGKNGIKVEQVRRTDLDYTFLNEARDKWWQDLFGDDDQDPFKPVEEEIGQYEQIVDYTENASLGAWNRSKSF